MSCGGSNGPDFVIESSMVIWPLSSSYGNLLRPALFHHPITNRYKLTPGLVQLNTKMSGMLYSRISLFKFGLFCNDRFCCHNSFIKNFTIRSNLLHALLNIIIKLFAEHSGFPLWQHGRDETSLPTFFFVLLYWLPMLLTFFSLTFRVISVLATLASP